MWEDDILLRIEQIRREKRCSVRKAVQVFVDGLPREGVNPKGDPIVRMPDGRCISEPSARAHLEGKMGECQRRRQFGASCRSKMGARRRPCGARRGGGYWAAGGLASAGEPAVRRRRLLCARR